MPPTSAPATALERLQLFKAANVRVRRCEVGLGLLVGARLCIGFLLGNRIRLAQVLPAVRGNLREIHLRRDLLPASARLGQLLIDFRSINIGEQLALFDVAANIFVPVQQISIGASVDGRLFVGLQ